MTSANVVHYHLLDSNNRQVKVFRQNRLCKFSVKDDIKAFITENGDCMMFLRYPDENEVETFTKPMKASEYLAGKKPEWLPEGEQP